jgi:hypothetical protein
VNMPRLSARHIRSDRPTGPTGFTDHAVRSGWSGLVNPAGETRAESGGGGRATVHGQV